MQTIDKAKANGLARFTSLVYLYTGLGIALWLVVANAIARNAGLSKAIFSLAGAHSIIFTILVVAVAFGFISLCNYFATRSYFMTFVSYVAFLVALSVIGVPIFYLYSAASITQALVVTSAVFIVAAAFGFITKKDLTTWSRTLMIGLISIIVVSLINILIFKSSMIMLLINIAVVVIFLFYIAFDSQNIKRIYAQAEGSESLGAIALVASINLVLDFINVFMSLLSIFGDSN
ncbi:Bax inhibitor-1 family protein [Companilactobacillus mishanensis]|uniref:Bax inhibitor-1/YccA family protein n=1 Tax=Companilactobacillus mishanensis TaxID=2486008 RepID=A0A5P0ZJE0_9LACO|nr:Bax inhibitor-1/YccA family protein [Companilactobacillus mishanensis]MQS53125.1 Bax inhibitor-1/YccA family protein [Companilactobacillus mishanensis]